MENNLKIHCLKCKTNYNPDTYVAKYKKNKCSKCHNLYIDMRNEELKKQNKKFCVDCKEAKNTDEFYDKIFKYEMNNCISCKQKYRDEMIYLFD